MEKKKEGILKAAEEVRMKITDVVCIEHVLKDDLEIVRDVIERSQVPFEPLILSLHFSFCDNLKPNVS